MDEELGDEQWKLIAPLLPRHQRRGRPRAEDRRTLNGILWVLRSGARWKDLPPKYGSRSTCHRRLQEWQDRGVWEQIRLKFLTALDGQAKLDWNQAFLDGSIVRQVCSVDILYRKFWGNLPGASGFSHPYPGSPCEG